MLMVMMAFDKIRRQIFLRLAAGAALLILGILVSDIPTMIESTRWTTTEGTIIKSRLVGSSVRGWDGELIFETDAHIRYQYEVYGSSYSSPAVNSIKSPFNLYPSYYASRYPVGKEVIVYYNPSNPAEAVLEPGFVDVIKAFDIYSYGLFAVGIYFIYRGISRRRKERNKLPINLSIN